MAQARKLGKRTDQRVQLVYSQASELLWHGRIETTVERAKEVRKVAEKMITLAINTYEDTVTVTKQKLNQKDEKIDVTFVNDGPKKLAARRKMMAELEDLQEVQADKEKKADFKKRTADILLSRNSSANSLPSTLSAPRSSERRAAIPASSEWLTAEATTPRCA